MEAVLIWDDITQNEAGFPKRKSNTVEVYAEEKEIVRSEFYEAMRSGVSVKKVLSLRIEDYELSRHQDEEGRTAYADRIKYDDEYFRIIRAYKKGKSKIELTCGDDV